MPIPSARPMSERLPRLKMPSLRALRFSRGMTQGQVARAMGVTQPAISRLESSGGWDSKALLRYVTALGGSVEVVITFPDREVTLQLGELFTAEAGTEKNMRAESKSQQLIQSLGHLPAKTALVHTVLASCAFARRAGFTAKQLAALMEDVFDKMPDDLQALYTPHVIDEK